MPYPKHVLGKAWRISLSRLSHATTALFMASMLSACGAAEITVVEHPPLSGKAATSRVVFLAGPDSHGPGEHEHRAGSELLAQSLRAKNPGVETVNVYGGWPEDESILDNADAIIMYCDGGKKHLINKHLQTFNAMLEQGTGIVALHYCVEVPRYSDSADSMLRATGGYFETWWSVNPHWEADFLRLPQHPVTRGITPFRQRDEWYFNMRFADSGVTPILSAVPPPDTMSRRNGPHSGNEAVRKMVVEGLPQVTAWAFERNGGGRGFGYTGGHFHSGWDDPNARSLIVNAIEWVAHITDH
jgi:type 1 glutamine amidotransferase